jgi:hypothetical protein
VFRNQRASATPTRAKAAREGLATYCFSGSAAEKSYKLYSAAPRATILNDVPTFSVGDAFLDLHCLFAYNAVQKTDQRAFIVVQMISHSCRLHFPFTFRPLIETPSRIAVFRMDSGCRPVFFAIAFKSMVLAISTKARSDAIDQW